MAEEVRIWQVGEGDALTEVKRSKLDLEARIQKWVSKDISLVHGSARDRQAGQNRIGSGD